MNAFRMASSRRGVVVASAGVALLAAWMVRTAMARDVTVKFLRAAVASLNERENVTVEGVYTASDGLNEPRDPYLREKGFSRFAIKDPESGVTFDSMYADHDSSAFRELLKVKEKQTFIFSGYKARGGSLDNDVVYVTSVKAVPNREEEKGSAPPPSPPSTYRVTIFDSRTTNRTVIANVQLGRTYTVSGIQLTVEEEPRDNTGVGVVH